MKFVRYLSDGNVSYGTLSDDTINELDGDPIGGYSRPLSKKVIVRQHI